MPQSSTTFSKTTFKTGENNEIALDAPDFWQQALKQIETPLDLLVKKKKILKSITDVEQQEELLV